MSSLDDVVSDTDLDITPEEIAAAKAELESARVDDNTFFLEDVDGRKEFLSFDGDQARIVVQEDLTRVQDACKALYNEGLANKRSEFRRIASFPPSVLQLWGRIRYGLTDPAWYLKREYQHLVVRAVHDRDLCQFRTLPGTYIHKGAA